MRWECWQEGWLGCLVVVDMFFSGAEVGWRGVGGVVARRGVGRVMGGWGRMGGSGLVRAGVLFGWVYGGESVCKGGLGFGMLDFVGWWVGMKWLGEVGGLGSRWLCLWLRLGLGLGLLE